MKMKLTISILFLALFIPGHSQPGGSPCPCCGPENRQFDFWVGDWVVYSNAEMIGFNKITKTENDCILRENWKSVVSSHTGSSYNYYDRTQKKWKHVWIGNDGMVVEVKGEFRDKKMVMVGDEYRDEKNNRIINRITWQPNADGTVRQVWEQSQDGGQTFGVLFDGLYRKRK